MAISPLKRVVILGGGHGGVAVARQLLKAGRPRDNLEIALVSHENVEVWHGLLPQIISSLVQPQHALVPLREILPGITLYTYDVEHIDLQQRRVTLTRGDERAEVILSFDYLVLALGAVTDLTRFPGLVEHGLQTKTIGDAFHLRDHLIDMLECAAVERDPDKRRAMLTFVVVGAGFAGVEIGAQANGLIREALRFYPTIKESEIRFIIVSNATRILPALSDALARRAARRMTRSGIELKLGVGVAAATANATILTTGERIPTRTTIVTVGIGPHPLIRRLPARLTDGRITCDGFCRMPSWPGVYAVGDDAAVPNPTTGAPCPATFLCAVTQGRCAANNILAEMRGQPLRRYAFDSVGELAFLSKGYALAQVKGLALDGLPAALLGRLAFVGYLPTWRRRLGVTLDWLTGSIFPRDITQLRIARSDALVPMRFGAGEVIIREGEPGRRFYVITEGEVEVVRQTADGREEHLNRLGPGQYFGEIALLHDVRRTATVRATTDTRVLSMARGDFSALVTHMPAFLGPR